MKTILCVQQFEERLVPAVSIDSAYETYAWALINALRTDPTAFANNLDGLKTGSVSSAFGFSKTDPIIADLKSMISGASVPAHYNQSLSLMRSTAAAGAFGWMELLENRADSHNQWMKVNGLEHTGVDSGNRFAIPGFTKNNSAAADTWGYSGEFGSWGENIGYAVGSLNASKAAYNAGSISASGFQQRAAFLDTIGYILELNSSSLGHLENLLGRDSGSSASLPEFNAIGIDTDIYQAPSLYEAQDGFPEAYVSTHRLGLYRPGGDGGFVSGLIFNDKNSNGFYDIGEGLAATVNVRNAGGGGFTDTLAANQHGAFSGFVGSGSYTVTIAIDGTVLDTQSVTVNDSNAWIDFGAQSLSKPTMSAPTGAQTTLRPTMAWNAVGDATAYQIRVDDLAAKKTNIFNFASTTALNWTPTADLVSGRSYRVWVRAVQGGTLGAWSDPKDFTIALPTRVGPLANVSTINPTFSWTAIAGARYEIRVDDVSALKSNLFPNQIVTGTSWTPPADFVSGRIYRWQVRAITTENLGYWSAWQNFGVNRPTLNNSASIANLRPQLTWSAITGATAYEVRVNDLSAAKFNIFPGARVTGTNWFPPNQLVSGRNYSWQVRAVNDEGRGGWTTLANFAIAKPTLSGPIGAVSDLTPTFAWSTISGSTSYVVNLVNVTLGKRVSLETVTGTNWTPATDLIAGHVYRWWVRATNTLSQGGWSVPNDFRVV